MSRIFKVLALIFIVMSSVVFSIKFLVEWRARDLLDDVLLRIALWTEASYESVELALPGNRIVVTGLEVKPREQPGDPVRIESVLVQVDDPLFFVARVLGISGQQMPDAGSLKLRGMTLPLDSPQLTQITDRLNRELSDEITPACGDVLFVGAREYRDMGYAQASVDFSVDYLFDSSRKALDLALSAQALGMSGIKLMIELGNVTELSQRKLFVAPPRLSRLTFEYHNHGYLQRLTEYCSEQEGQTIAEYIRQEGNRENNYYAVMWGIVPGDAIRQAYTHFLEKPETVKISMAPREDFDVTHLSMYTANDWPALLRMELHINDQRVTPLAFSLPNRNILSTALAQTGLVEVDVEPQRVPNPEPEKKPELPIVHYKTLTLDNLDRYVGQEIRLQRRNAVNIDGVLVAVERHKVRIRQKMYGGEVTLPVKREDILSLAVKIVDKVQGL